MSIPEITYKVDENFVTPTTTHFEKIVSEDIPFKYFIANADIVPQKSNECAVPTEEANRISPKIDKDSIVDGIGNGEMYQLTLQEYDGPYSDPDNPPIDMGNGFVGYAKPTGRVLGWYDTKLPDNEEDGGLTNSNHLVPNSF